jgi:hypothetical protein
MRGNKLSVDNRRTTPSVRRRSPKAVEHACSSRKQRGLISLATRAKIRPRHQVRSLLQAAARKISARVLRNQRKLGLRVRADIPLPPGWPPPIGWTGPTPYFL